MMIHPLKAFPPLSTNAQASLTLLAKDYGNMNADSKDLYVGITNDPKRRRTEHNVPEVDWRCLDFHNEKDAKKKKKWFIDQGFDGGGGGGTKEDKPTFVYLYKKTTTTKR
ncbi:MAG: hypothetical protein GY822_22125 [Deltaproteobacteria bacterium]|nr:hypothetical protein [Deltaproteobacteria bacterium]